MDILELRKEIDKIDDQLVKLFSDRMDVAAKIAEYKMQNNMRVLDAKREREKLNDIIGKSPEEMKSYTGVLYSLLFELSRSYQGKLLAKETALSKEITYALDNTNKLFPIRATVACQGTEGAYSQAACEKLFKTPDIMYMQSFENVFSAIEKGLCEYGILPLENSTAGSVTTVYELMMKHKFNIVKSVRIKIDHSLYANSNVTDLSQIKEIISHEQAIRQCSEFIQSLGKDVKVTTFENTALAAKYVAESGRDDIAALASPQCGALYGLKRLKSCVQDNDNNYTRFICISKNLEIYPGADKAGIMMILPHKAGALYKVLARFYALGINLIKLESRPLPGRNFEFMFYFELETSVYAEEFKQIICELDTISEEFCYLGSYSEVI
ncbi:MAG: chorismate mutase [Clostridia bacterium]|nr:chorismate mutase [Clostridia bacterium]